MLFFNSISKKKVILDSFQTVNVRGTYPSDEGHVFPAGYEAEDFLKPEVMKNLMSCAKQNQDEKLEDCAWELISILISPLTLKSMIVDYELIQTCMEGMIKRTNTSDVALTFSENARFKIMTGILRNKSISDEIWNAIFSHEKIVQFLEKMLHITVCEKKEIGFPYIFFIAIPDNWMFFIKEEASFLIDYMVQSVFTDSLGALLFLFFMHTEPHLNFFQKEDRICNGFESYEFLCKMMRIENFFDQKDIITLLTDLMSMKDFSYPFKQLRKLFFF